MEKKQQIFEALKASLVSNNNILKDVNNFLHQMQKEKGYCNVLMEIFTSNQVQDKIRQAAVIQLKLLVSFRWRVIPKDQQKGQKAELEAQQKKFIKENILKQTINNYQKAFILKICQKIIESITDYEGQKWDISPFLIQKLSESQRNIVPVLHCMTAVATGYQHFLSPNKQSCVVFARNMFPCLQQIFDKFRTRQICYLIFKVIYKLCHFDLQDYVREQILKWMPVLKLILEEANQQFERTTDLDNQIKGTEIFYYFHSKKWAARILSTFFLTHLKTKTLNKKLKEKVQSNKKWFETSGKQLLQILYTNLERKQPTKVNFFILKCFEGALTNYPEIIQPMAASLQFQILPQLLKINRNDVINAKQQPLQFIANEDVSIVSCMNVKVQATKIWKLISQIGYLPQTKKSPAQQGKYFNDSLQYIRRLLLATPNPEKPQSEQPYLNKELGMYLLISISSNILSIRRIEQMVPQLLEAYIIPELQSSVMLLRSRAVQVFGSFADTPISLQTLQIVAKSVSSNLVNPNSQSLVKIKSAIALYYIVRKTQAKDFLKPYLAELLKAYIQIMNKFDVQLLVNSFQIFLQAFSDCISPYAQELVVCLIQACQRMTHRQFEVTMQSSKKKKFVDSGIGSMQCLKAIITIMEGTDSQPFFIAIEDRIFNLSMFLLEYAGSDYEQELFLLLTTFFYKKGEIKDKFWFFYVAFIYSISGPCQQTRAIKDIPDTIIKPNEKHVLSLVTIQVFTDLAEQGFNIVRQFIQFGANNILILKDYFGNTFWQLLYKYIVYPLQNKNSDQSFYNKDVVICNNLALAINFVETVDILPEKPAYQLWQLVKRIYDNYTKKSIKCFNTQLLCLLIYKSKGPLVQQIYKENRIQQFDKEVSSIINVLQQNIHQIRVIFGLCQFFKAPCHRKQKIKSIDSIYRSLIQLLGDTVQDRLGLEDLMPQGVFCLKIDREQSKNPLQNKSGNKNQNFKEVMKKLTDMNIFDKKIGQQDQEDQQIYFDNDEQDQEQDLDGDDSFLGEMWDQQYGETYSSNLEMQDEVKYFQNTIKEIEVNNKQFACYLQGKLQNYGEFVKYLQKAISKYEYECEEQQQQI